MAGVLAGALALAGCSQQPSATPEKGKSQLMPQPFGKLPDGTAIDLYTLSNGKGMEARIMTYGATLVSLTAPDKTGKYADVVQGMDSVDGYVKGVPYFGATIGRYGNRIGHAQFTLEGQTYHTPKNDGDNTLHGGVQGFDKRVWTARDTGNGVEFTYVSKDGEEGFPGTLTSKVVYSVTPENELRIEYTATTDKPTVLNLTNHSYFNLAGQGEGDILGHEVTILADRFTPVDAGLIPTGELKPVAGTPFDFTKSTAIGARIEQKDQQLIFGKGYDHNWVLNGTGMKKAAEVYEPKTGRVMEVMTDQPGLQFYTGNFLDGKTVGKGGAVYKQHDAFCMEPQKFPNSVNVPEWKEKSNAILRPGETYKQTTIYKFGVVK